MNRLHTYLKPSLGRRIGSLGGSNIGSRSGSLYADGLRLSVLVFVSVSICVCLLIVGFVLYSRL